MSLTKEMCKWARWRLAVYVGAAFVGAAVFLVFVVLFPILVGGK